MRSSFLPRDIALAIGTAAAAKLDLHLRAAKDSDTASRATPKTLQSTYASVVVLLSARTIGTLQEQELHDYLVELRENIDILNTLACCDGYELHENLEVWTEIWNSRKSFVHNDPKANLLVPSPGHVSPRFVFRASMNGYWENKLYNVMQKLIELSNSNTTTSVGYRSSMETLNAFVNRSKLSPILRCGVDITVRPHSFLQPEMVTSSSPSWDFHPTELEQIDALVDFSHSHSGQENHLWSGGAALVIGEVFLTMNSCIYMSKYEPYNDMAASLAMFRNKIGSLELHVGSWEGDGAIVRNHVQPFRSMMWAMAHNEPNTLSQQSTALSIPRVELSGESLSSSFLGAFFCALPSFPSIRELRLVKTRASRTNWEWLVFALFHPAARSSVQSLQLSNEFILSPDDIYPLRRLLDESWQSAIQHLLSQSDGQGVDDKPLFRNFTSISSKKVTDTIRWAHVKRNTHIQAKPQTILLPKKALVVLNHDEVFQVIDILSGLFSDWICLLLPGYGCGFVTHRDVTSIQEVPVISQPSQLRSLSIHSIDTNATLKFLAMIKAPLSSLDVTFHTSVSAKDFSDLLRYCPNLTQLKINAPEISDLSPLFEMYAQGICVISSLHINKHYMRWTNLMKQLLDPTSKCHLHLRELSLGSSYLTENDLEDALEILETNRTLRFVHIPIRENLVDEYMHQFIAHRDDRVGLPLMTKLAFLSAIGYHSRSHSRLKNAERSIMETIFAFASEQKRLISIGKAAIDEATFRYITQPTLSSWGGR